MNNLSLHQMFGLIVPLCKNTTEINIKLQVSTVSPEEPGCEAAKLQGVVGCQEVLHPGIQDARHRTFCEAQIWLIICEMPFLTQRFPSPLSEAQVPISEAQVPLCRET